MRNRKNILKIKIIHKLIGFGTFKLNVRKARTGRNPRTGEEIKIAEAKVPAFVAGKALKDSVK